MATFHAFKMISASTSVYTVRVYDNPAMAEAMLEAGLGSVALNSLAQTFVPLFALGHVDAVNSSEAVCKVLRDDWVAEDRSDTYPQWPMLWFPQPLRAAAFYYSGELTDAAGHQLFLFDTEDECAAWLRTRRTEMAAQQERLKSWAEGVVHAGGRLAAIYHASHGRFHSRLCVDERAWCDVAPRHETTRP